MSARVNRIGRGDHRGRVIIACNVRRCSNRFTINSFRTGKTRIHAEAQGWAVGTRDVNLDFCHEHAAQHARAARES